MARSGAFAAAALVVTAISFVPAAQAVTDPGLATVSAVQPRILVWGHGAFIGREAFDAWLRRHRQSYGGWASAHPAAVAVLAHSVAPFGFRASQRAPTITESESVAEATDGRVATSSHFHLETLLLVLGGLIVLVSAVPLLRIPSSAPAVVAIEQRRLGLAAAGAAIIIGVGIARLMS